MQPERSIHMCLVPHSENKVQIRGPSYQVMYDSDYLIHAKKANLALSKKSWTSCKLPGLRLLAKELRDCDPATLKVGRCARHSKFAECQSCQDNRKNWLAATQKSGSHPSVIQSLYDIMIKHKEEWSSDRATALVLRRGMYDAKTSDGCYECDDKCGSFWQQLPVDSTGRCGKEAVNKVFKFSVQANIIPGLGE
jgi:hypothetical protein